MLYDINEDLRTGKNRKAHATIKTCMATTVS